MRTITIDLSLIDIVQGELQDVAEMPMVTNTGDGLIDWDDFVGELDGLKWNFHVEGMERISTGALEAMLLAAFLEALEATRAGGEEDDE